MVYYKINTDWNADPNSPELRVSVEGIQIKLEFFLNYFQFENFHEGDKAIVRFYNCHKYSLNSMNDEGYYLRQYRYTNDDLPWGEFYKIQTNCESDFPEKQFNVLTWVINSELLNHYIFFFRDNCFECVAEGYDVEFISVASKVTNL